jgi:hypothetical protein
VLHVDATFARAISANVVAHDATAAFAVSTLGGALATTVADVIAAAHVANLVVACSPLTANTAIALLFHAVIVFVLAPMPSYCHSFC